MGYRNITVELVPYEHLLRTPDSEALRRPKENEGIQNPTAKNPTQSSFLILFIPNSARCSWIPGSEPILLDLEKLLLLSDSIENIFVVETIEFQNPQKIGTHVKRSLLGPFFGTN